MGCKLSRRANTNACLHHAEQHTSISWSQKTSSFCLFSIDKPSFSSPLFVEAAEPVCVAGLADFGSVASLCFTPHHYSPLDPPQLQTLEIYSSRQPKVGSGRYVILSDYLDICLHLNFSQNWISAEWHPWPFILKRLCTQSSCGGWGNSPFYLTSWRGYHRFIGSM